MRNSLLFVASIFLLAGCVSSQSKYIPQVKSENLLEHSSACSGGSYTFTKKLNPNISFEVDTPYMREHYTVAARFRLASKHSIQFLDNQIAFHDLGNSNVTELKIVGAYSGMNDPSYATAYGLPEIRLNPLSQMIGEFREANMPMAWGEWSHWRDKDRDVINLEISQLPSELPNEFEITFPQLKVDGDITKVERIRFKWVKEIFVQCIQ